MSANINNDFGFEMKEAGFIAKKFKQEGFKLSFEIDNQEFTMNAIGQHTVENATAAVAVANQIRVDLKLVPKVYQNMKEFIVVIRF